MSVTIEDQGVLSATGVLRPQFEGGSIVQHVMKEAHKRDVAHPQGIADMPMVRITVGVPGGGAELQIVKLMLETGIIRAPQRKMGTAAVLARSPKMIGALFMMKKMMRIMHLRDAANQIKLQWFEWGRCWLQSVFVRNF